MSTTTACRLAHHVDHVGSFVRPATLMTAWRENETGRLTDLALKAIQDTAIRDVVKMQQDVGLSVVTDGEFRRGGWSRGFLSAVSGFDFLPSRLVFRSDDGVSTAAPAPVATGKLARLHPIVTDDFTFLRSVATATPKVTMPTPSHLHFGHFGAAATAYPDIAEYWADLTAIYRAEIADLAAAGCRFLQLDEVPLTLCCDDTNRGIACDAGEDPDKLVDTYIAMINAALQGRPADMVVVMHLCRGNMNAMWMGDGGYDRIAEKLFNTADVDGFLMEYDSPRAGDFSPLRFMPAGKRGFLGLISTKRPAIEPLDMLLRRVDEAAKHAPLDRLGLCPQCGFGSSAMSKFNVLENPMTEAIQRQKLARLVEAGSRIW
jgi:5-methyltetrahydropteroyltriglutamate--homocysteine methyltransferase